MTVPGDVLDKVHILRCSYNYTKTCSAAEGQFTDFNFWDRAFSLEEAKDWTTCRWSSEPAPLKMYFIKKVNFLFLYFFRSMEKGNLVNFENAKVIKVHGFFGRKQ